MFHFARRSRSLLLSAPRFAGLQRPSAATARVSPPRRSAPLSRLALEARESLARGDEEGALRKFREAAAQDDGAAAVSAAQLVLRMAESSETTTILGAPAAEAAAEAEQQLRDEAERNSAAAALCLALRLEATGRIDAAWGHFRAAASEGHEEPAPGAHYRWGNALAGVGDERAAEAVWRRGGDAAADGAAAFVVASRLW